ncbi:reverse transcriptase domain-containing protein, partial [Staphylococcus aureus]|nr:reverse transcriptase domain-containing protein [Staphylococcus aureus]
MIDHLLRSLPRECGATFNGQPVRAMAFADDLVLLADSAVGLQTSLDRATAFLAECGLKFNLGKCHTVSLFGDGNRRRTVVDASRTFTING